MSFNDLIEMFPVQALVDISGITLNEIPHGKSDISHARLPSENSAHSSHPRSVICVFIEGTHTCISIGSLVDN